MKRQSGSVDRGALLDEVRDLCGQGQAENEPENEATFLKNFLPVRSHYKIVDPDAQLIIGDKGAGKTQVFRALSYPDGRAILAKLARDHGRVVADLKDATWLIGFAASGQEFPPGGAIRVFATRRAEADLQTFWLGMLVRVLLKKGEIREGELPASLLERLCGGTWQLEELAKPLEKHQGELFGAIDALDQQLEATKRYVFVTYDDLDRVSPGDWKALETILRGLVQFWAAYGRRWRRVRPKLFLRRDLYQRAALFGPDIAKIAAHRVEILWDISEFYGVLFKRILNSQGNLRRFVGEDALRWEDAGALGRLPIARSETAYEKALEKLFGEFMGSDPRKGFTFRWIPNHLKDGHRRIYPRPLLRLVEEASGIEKRDGRAGSLAHLIHHTALRGALDRVSEFRVLELEQEEFPWLARIRSAFEQRPFLVPAERRDVLRALSIRWGDGEHRPPSVDPSDLLDYLGELGITQMRRDGRVDVGDLYLRGLRLKRKGGVARPRGLQRG